MEKACEIATHKVFKQNAKNNPLIERSCPCPIDGVYRDVHFADWGIKETAHSLNGNKKMYWLKNEVLNNVQYYIANAQYAGNADVDLTHNTNRNTLRLKRKFVKYHYLKFSLADGQEAYFNIVQHSNGNYYMYTISKKNTCVSIANRHYHSQKLAGPMIIAVCFQNCKITKNNSNHKKSKKMSKNRHFKNPENPLATAQLLTPNS